MDYACRLFRSSVCPCVLRMSAKTVDGNDAEKLPVSGRFRACRAGLSHSKVGLSGSGMT